MEDLSNNSSITELGERRYSYGVDQYGEVLGVAFDNYTEDKINCNVSQEARTNFAEAVVTAFESQDHGQRVMAISALLEAGEELDYCVAYRADEDLKRATRREMPVWPFGKLLRQGE